MLKNFLFSAAFIITLNYAWAQPGQQADISITSVTITELKPRVPGKFLNAQLTPVGTPPAPKQAAPLNDLKCTITVHNENGGIAFGATLIVLLPIDVTIVSNPFIATINRAGPQNRTGMPGSLVFEFPEISSGDDRTIEFTFTQSTHGNKISAYAYSSCPDPNPSNNYKDAVF
jgi:hypothetical protein